MIDSEYQFAASMSYMQAWAAVHGSSSADLKGAVSGVRQLYGDALGAVPYLTGGQTGEDLANSDRMSAVQKFIDYRERTLKPTEQHEKHEIMEKPVAASKHKSAPIFGPAASQRKEELESQGAPDSEPQGPSTVPTLFKNAGLSRRG